MIEICKNRGLHVVQTDFCSFNMPEASCDGIWAYSSHTVVREALMPELLDKYRKILKPLDGILALGMIEGEGEGWKSDQKYCGRPRYVCRFSLAELETLLNSFFGSVWIKRVQDPDRPNRSYLHAICRNTTPFSMSEIKKAAEKLFNEYGEMYAERTKKGKDLLKSDLKVFIQKLNSIGGRQVLDLGSGPGRDAFELKNHGLEVTCIDISEKNVVLCQKKGLHAMVGDMLDLEALFPEKTFDGVWANCSMSNWLPKDEISRMTTVLKCVTKPNAYVFVGSILGSFQGWEIDEKYGKLPRFNVHWDEDELLDSLTPLGHFVHRRSILPEESGRKHYLNLIIEMREAII